MLVLHSVRCHSQRLYSRIFQQYADTTLFFYESVVRQ